MSGQRFLVLGAGNGWHRNQLQQSARAAGVSLEEATYESLHARIQSTGTESSCESGSLQKYDAILTRTMPSGSMEMITFRLAILHHLHSLPHGPAIVNPPRALEIAIDKFATLAHVRQLGIEVPDTIVVQSRAEAMDAFSALGGDCIVKPIFGGEGRGVMRIRDRELAWTAVSTLEQLDAVMYVQRFVPPGGSDTRILSIGDRMLGIRRSNGSDFRANVASGGRCEAVSLSSEEIEIARQVIHSIGLKFAAVDLLYDEHGTPQVIEVNAIPGWKGAQSVTAEPIADHIIRLLKDSTRAEVGCR